MAIFNKRREGGKGQYFGLTGGWLTFWVVRSCSLSVLPFPYPFDLGSFKPNLGSSDTRFASPTCPQAQEYVLRKRQLTRNGAVSRVCN